MTSSAYGTAIPLCWGQNLVGGALIWSTDLIPHVKTTHQGKGGGISTKEYSYTASFAFKWAGNIQPGVRRIWFGDKVVFDVTQTPASLYPCVHYLGDGPQDAAFTHRKMVIDQIADPIIAAKEEKTPAYRGHCYSVFYDWPLADWGDSVAGLNPRAELACVTPITDVPIPIGNLSFDFGGIAAQFTVTGGAQNTHDGGEVTRWTDVGAKHHLQPDFEVGPVFRASFRNGLPVAHFTAHTTIGDGDWRNWTDLHSPAHVFMVLYVDQWAASDVLFGGILGVECRLTGSGIEASQDGATYLTRPGQPTDWFVLDVLFNGSNSWLRVNGGQKTVGDMGSAAPTDLHGLNLAAGRNNGAFYVGRVLGYSGGQSDVNAQTIISKLKSQFAIT